MTYNKMTKTILTLVCAVCFIGAIGFSGSALSCEGALAVAAAFWLFRVEMRRAGRYHSDLPQVFGLLFLGGVLWLIGDAPMVDMLSGSGSAKLALLGLLARSIGFVMIPACFFFYVASPSRPIKANMRSLSASRPAASEDYQGYRIAI